MIERIDDLPAPDLPMSRTFFLEGFWAVGMGTLLLERAGGLDGGSMMDWIRENELRREYDRVVRPAGVIINWVLYCISGVCSSGLSITYLCSSAKELRPGSTSR